MYFLFPPIHYKNKLFMRALYLCNYVNTEIALISIFECKLWCLNHYLVLQYLLQIFFNDFPCVLYSLQFASLLHNVYFITTYHVCFFQQFFMWCSNGMKLFFLQKTIISFEVTLTCSVTVTPVRQTGRTLASRTSWGQSPTQMMTSTMAERIGRLFLCLSSLDSI